MSRGHFLSAALLGLAGVLLAVSVSSAEGPSVEAAGGGYSGYYWRPSSTEVEAGGSLSFRNSSATVPHGVVWDGGPETPACTGVPIDEGKTSWSGNCTFAKPGTYNFKCYVHPTEMTGTVTVSSNGTVTVNPPPAMESAEPPLNGPLSHAVKLARKQLGADVRGYVEISQAGEGSLLEIALLARRSVLFGAGRSGMIRVGRLLRRSLQGGQDSFAVALNRPARLALQRRKRLALSVEITVNPPSGTALKVTRTVVVHG